MKQDWNAVRTQLIATDLYSYVPATPRIVFKPKSGTAFRVTHDIDIRDFLLLSAAVFDFGGDIEAHRDPLDNGRIFSNRFQPHPGHLVQEKTYDLFQAQNLKFARDPQFSHVLSLDLTDFYNQISTHRVENALEEAGLDRSNAKTIEELLLTLNLRSSRGIPVGQEFSNLLAEAALFMVDEWLIERKVSFTRYVDDFRIYVSSYAEALQFIQSFTELLNRETLKFTLNDDKTRIFRRETFLNLESVDPAKREESERYKRYKAKVEEAIEWLRENWDEPYAPPPGEDDLDEDWREEKNKEAFAEALGSLFDEALYGEPPDYLMLRHLLAKCTQQRRSVLIGRVVRSLERLAPIFQAAIRYLRAVATWFKDEHRNALLSYAETGPRSGFRYTQIWLAWLFFEKPSVLAQGIAAQVLNKWGKDAAEYRFMAAILAKNADVVRSAKQQWTNFGVYERRWLILAAQTLPPSERSAFQKAVEKNGDPIEIAIARSL